MRQLGRDGDLLADAAPRDGEVLSSHTEPQRRRPLSRPVKLLAGLVVVGLAGGAVTSALDRDPRWPRNCGVAGNAAWCAAPSAVMTDPAMTALVLGYCPDLSRTSASDVVPQPLSQLDLADEETFAVTSGTVRRGSENALLGQPGNVAWLTRWVGGEGDGLVELRCPGASAEAPSLALEAEQLRSTLAASADIPGIDFGDVAKDTVDAISAGRQSGLSFGFTRCDTDGIDLRRPRVGERFSCLTEIYGPEGKSGHPSFYRVSRHDPYFISD